MSGTLPNGLAPIKYRGPLWTPELTREINDRLGMIAKMVTVSAPFIIDMPKDGHFTIGFDPSLCDSDECPWIPRECRENPDLPFCPDYPRCPWPLCDDDPCEGPDCNCPTCIPPCTDDFDGDKCQCWDGTVVSDPDECPDCNDGTRPDPKTGECRDQCWSGASCDGKGFGLFRVINGYKGDVVYDGFSCWILDNTAPCPEGSGTRATVVSGCNDPKCLACREITSCQSGETLTTTTDLSGESVIEWNGDCWIVGDFVDCTGSEVSVAGYTPRTGCADANCPAPCGDCSGAQPAATASGSATADMHEPTPPGGYLCSVSVSEGASLSYRPDLFTSTGTYCRWYWDKHDGSKSYTLSVQYNIPTDDYDISFTVEDPFAFLDTCSGGGLTCNVESVFWRDTGNKSGFKCNKDTGKLEGTVTIPADYMLSACDPQNVSGTATITLG